MIFWDSQRFRFGCWYGYCCLPEKISICNSRRKLHISMCRASSALSNVIPRSAWEFRVAEILRRTFGLFLSIFHDNKSWNWLEISSISICIRESRLIAEIGVVRAFKRDVDELASSHRWKDAEQTLMGSRLKINWNPSKRTASCRIRTFS